MECRVIGRLWPRSYHNCHAVMMALIVCFKILCTSVAAYGKDLDVQNNMNLAEDHVTDELPSGGTLLYGQYTIERHLIDGGFGMTYLARDSLDRRVVVKECFPCAICHRVSGDVRPRKPSYQDQYESVISNFLREALRLAKFEHPNIVKVHQVFQENNTAYIAMDFVDGMDLLTMLDVDPGRMTDDVILNTLRETLNALDYVHEFGMLHRDISPDNLLLDADNKLTLIDFGAASDVTRQQTHASPSVLSVKDGYSPHEFYYTDGAQERSSDIYSVGATFYHLITGYAPPDAQKRTEALSAGDADPYKPLSNGAWSFSKAFLASIDKALSVSQKKRFQSAGEWLELLETSAADPVRQEAHAVVELVDKPRSKDTLRHKEGHRITNTPQPNAAPKVDVQAEPVELEPSVARAITTLVKDTNDGLEPALPGKIRQTAEANRPAVVEEEPTNRLVDMFGYPIEDVDEWLREQDKLSKRQHSRQPRYMETPEPPNRNTKSEPDSDVQGERSGSGLSRMLNAFVKRRRRTSAMVQT